MGKRIVVGVSMGITAVVGVVVLDVTLARQQHRGIVAAPRATEQAAPRAEDPPPAEDPNVEEGSDDDPDDRGPSPPPRSR